jgi:hypothetical protein
MSYVKKNKTICVVAFLIALYSLLITAVGSAAIFDRVVASVEDQAITLSERTAQYERTRTVSPDITMEEVLNTMINRALLLREARKYRIEARSREEIVREFIDLKIRAFIRVSEAETEDFYRKNAARFEGKDFEAVREEIEHYLTELRMNERLKETLAGLRRSANITVQLDSK